MFECALFSGKEIECCTWSVLLVLFVLHCPRKSLLQASLSKWRNLDCVLFCCKACRKPGRMKEVYRGNFRCSRVFLSTSSALPLPKCFQTEQSTAEASLFVFWLRVHLFPHTFSLVFSNQNLFSKRRKVASSCICSLIKRAKMSQSQSLSELLK